MEMRVRDPIQGMNEVLKRWWNGNRHSPVRGHLPAAFLGAEIVDIPGHERWRSGERSN